MKKKPPAPQRDELLRCSFCDKPQMELKKLIQGPKGVSICDECVRLCADIVGEEKGS